jgi:hypothetical protein
MKYLPAIAGALLGLLFVVFSLIFLLKLASPPPADNSPSPFHGGVRQTDTTPS